MGRVEFRRPCPPLQAPRLHGSQEGRTRGDYVSSLLALPCRCRCGSVDCGVEGAGGAFTAGSGQPSLASSAAEREQGGGGGRRGTCPLWTCWPLAPAACDPGVGIDDMALHGDSQPPRCGQKHRGATPEAHELQHHLVASRKEWRVVDQRIRGPPG